MAENEVFHRLRRDNLARLIQEQSEGNVAAFARKHGIIQSRLNRYVATKAEAKPMGFIAARSLEQQIGLEERALDRMPDGTFPEVPIVTVKPSTLSAEVAVQNLCGLAEAVPVMRRRIVAALASQIIENPENIAFRSLLSEELERHLD